MTDSADRDSAGEQEGLPLRRSVAAGESDSAMDGSFLWRASPRLRSAPPVVFLPGLGAHSLGRTRGQRLLQRLEVLGLARTFQVWLLARRAPLRRGITIEDLAEEHAEAIRARFGRAVDVIGESTGGSVALQLAGKHPELVNRLVIVSAAARMRREGQRAQLDAAQSIRRGDRRRAAGAMLGTTTRQAGRARMLWAAGYLLGPLVIGRDGEDLAVMIDAEDGFDVRADLARISAPTLLIGGERDGYYSPDILDETAAILPNAVHLQLPRKGHLSVARDRTVRHAIHHYLLDSASDPGSGPRRGHRRRYHLATEPDASTPLS